MAVDYFLKIDGIDGESKDSKHSGEIDLESFSWGETQTGSHGFGGGGGAGKVQMQDFHFVMKINKASPELMLACAEGRHIKSAELICRKAGKDQQEFLKVKFSDLMISSYQTGGSGNADVLPMDSIAFNFVKIEVEYKPQKEDGTLAGPHNAGWNLKENKKI